MPRNVLYMYDPDVGNYFYGPGHPMKPHRVRMTHDLLQSYGILNRMELMVPTRPTAEDLTQFHANDYIDFLRSTSEPQVSTPQVFNYNKQNENISFPQHSYNMGLPYISNVYNASMVHSAEYSPYVHNNTVSILADQSSRFNVGEDCPVFDGLWDYCKLYSGGSIEGARRVVKGEYQYAINWAGGLHHGKKHEASGFCYVNDCVLAALEFLRYKHRVLYVDVDIHHGDGVEEAFYTSPRVLCCSFHKYGHFFPGTGALGDIGVEEGLGYSVNIPLQEGIDDSMYGPLFRRVMDKIMESYQPEAVVLQSGADSVAGDRLGCFNLSIDGHSEAVRYFLKANVPTIFLGGGGYTLRNVPRCWAKETSHILGVNLDPKIPETAVYKGYYGIDTPLNVPVSNMENRNDSRYIESIVTKVSEVLRQHVYPVGAQISANTCTYDEDTGTELLKDIKENDDENDDKDCDTQNYEFTSNRDIG